MNGSTNGPPEPPRHIPVVDDITPPAIAFGNVCGYPVPRFVTELLWGIVREVERIETDRRQEVYDAPTGWDAEHVYATDLFTLRGFTYEDRRPQFATTLDDGRALEIRWYKHLGRCMTSTLELAPTEWIAVYDQCIDYLRANETWSR